MVSLLAGGDRLDAAEYWKRAKIYVSPGGEPSLDVFAPKKVHRKLRSIKKSQRERVSRTEARSDVIVGYCREKET